MRKSYFSIFIGIFFVNTLIAQDYYIDYTASGESETWQAIEARNLTQSTSVTLASGERLRLVRSATAINNLAISDATFEIFPNPSNSVATLRVYFAQNEIADIRILDISGKCLLQKQIELSKGTNFVQVENLTSGVNFVEIQSKSNKISGKIISNGNSTSSINISKVETMSLSGFSVDKTGVAEQLLDYTDGDILLCKAISGDFSTIVTDIPTSSKTIDFEFISCVDGSSNNYPVVKIGQQIWMAENLKATQYINGDPITTANYNNLIDEYGLYYLWDAAMNNTTTPGAQGACPVGWHIPTEAEWNTLLVTTFGGDAGRKMKETGTTYWNPSSYPGSNESGFSARGTGEIMFGMTNNFKTRTTYHSSTEATNTSDFKAVMLHKDADNANVTTTNKILIAYPVRCLQDSN